MASTETETPSVTPADPAIAWDPVLSLTGATVLFAVATGVALFLYDALQYATAGLTELGGAVALAVLAVLLVAFAWALVVRGVTGLARVVATDAFGRY